MNTPLIATLAFAAFTSFAIAEPQPQSADPKKDARAPQVPAASGTTNGGDVDRSIPKVDHGTQKTAADEQQSKDQTKKSESKEPMKPGVGKADPSDKDQPKTTERDHGVDKATQPTPKDGTDPNKDAKTEEKTDKISDHEHGPTKQKN